MSDYQKDNSFLNGYKAGIATFNKDFKKEPKEAFLPDNWLIKHSKEKPTEQQTKDICMGFYTARKDAQNYYENNTEDVKENGLDPQKYVRPKMKWALDKEPNQVDHEKIKDIEKSIIPTKDKRYQPIEWLKETHLSRGMHLNQGEKSKMEIIKDMSKDDLNENEYLHKGFDVEKLEQAGPQNKICDNPLNFFKDKEYAIQHAHQDNIQKIENNIVKQAQNTKEKPKKLDFTERNKKMLSGFMAQKGITDTNTINNYVNKTINKLSEQAQAEIHKRCQDPVIHYAGFRQNEQDNLKLVGHKPVPNREYNSSTNFKGIDWSYRFDPKGGPDTPERIYPEHPYIKENTERKPQKGDKVVWDTETTGLNAHEGDRIYEIAMIKYDKDNKPTGDELHAFLNPATSIPPIITQITGVTGDELQDKPYMDKPIEYGIGVGYRDEDGKSHLQRTNVTDAIEKMFNSTDQHIAHNATFDEAMMNAEFKRADKPTLPENKMVDTLRMALDLPENQPFQIKTDEDLKRAQGYQDTLEEQAWEKAKVQEGLAAPKPEHMEYKKGDNCVPKNTLDALADRYGFKEMRQTRDKEGHGALLDVQLLHKVHTALEQRHRELQEEKKEDIKSNLTPMDKIIEQHGKDNLFSKKEKQQKQAVIHQGR